MMAGMDKITAGGRLHRAAIRWDDLPQRFPVSARTVARWRARGLPPLVDALLAVWGDLGVIHPAWRGWMISARDGLLYSPENEGKTPGEVRARFWDREQIKALRRQVRKLRSELEARPPLRDQRWKPKRAAAGRPARSRCAAPESR